MEFLAIVIWFQDKLEVVNLRDLPSIFLGISETIMPFALTRISFQCSSWKTTAVSTVK
jgi:hypothetical protein